MAKNSLAEVSEKLLAVKARLNEGQKLGDACKAAGVSPGTYKKWLEKYAEHDLPNVVVPAPTQGSVALSGDGRWLFTVGVEGRQYVVARYDAATGVETARAAFDPPVAPGRWLEVMCVCANREGTQLLCVASDGVMFAWEGASTDVRACATDLRGRGVKLQGRTTSSATTRAWSEASIAPDLAHVACWSRSAEEPASELARLCVLRVADGAVVFEFEMRAASIASPIEFHPTRPLVAALEENQLIMLFDYAQGRTLVARGPQVHAVSFAPGDTLLCDDWYARTQSFNYVTGESRVVATGWGSLASETDRFVTTSAKHVELWSGDEPARRRRIDFEGIIETVLSRDGSRVAVRGDRVCVWDLDATPRTASPTTERREPARVT